MGALLATLVACAAPGPADPIAFIESSPVCVGRATRLSATAPRAPLTSARQRRRELDALRSAVDERGDWQAEIALQLCLGHYDASIAVLRSLPAAGGHRREAYLAIAYLEKADLESGHPKSAEGGSGPLSLLRAVSHATRAEQLLPGDPRTAHNAALALERLSLFESSLAKWRELLPRLADPSWVAQVLARIRALERLLERTRNADAALASIESYEQTATRLRAARHAPDLAFRLFEEQLLATWSQAVAGHSEQVPRWEALLRELAEVIEERGDSSLSAIVGDILTADHDPLSVELISSYADGVRHYRADQWDEAKELLEQTVAPLRELSPTLAGRAGFFLARCERAHDADNAQRFAELYSETPDAHGFFKGQNAWFASMAHHAMGEELEALRWARWAEPLIERGAGRRAAVFTKIIAAGPLEALGRHEQSWEGRIEALHAIVPSQDYWQKHSLLLNSAFSLIRLGLSERALPFFDELVLNAESWGHDRSALAEVLIQRSKLHAQLGHHEQALEDVRHSRVLLTSVVGDQSWNLLEADIAEGLARIDAAPREAMDLLESAYTEQLARGQRMELLPVTLARAAALQQLGESVAALQILEVAANEVAALATAATTSTPPTASDLKRLSRQLARLYSRRFEIARAAGLSSEQLLQLANQTHCPSLALPARSWDTPALLSDLDAKLAGDEIVIVITPVADRLRFFGLTSSGLVTAESRSPAAPMLAGTELWTAFVGPVAAWLDGKTRVHFVLHGSLSRLQLSAALDPVSGRYLIEQHVVSFWPRLEMLALARRRPASNPPQRATLLAYSGIRALESEAAGRPRLPPLAAALEEVARIATLYRASPTVEVAATAEALEQALRSADVVHFAGHAILTGTAPIDATLVLAPSPASPQGLFDVDRIRSLGPLQPQVVVLSGCETAIGFGEEAVPDWGLTAELVRGGAHFVLAALEPFTDTEAISFLQGFHREIASGVAPERAYRKVAMDSIRQGDTIWRIFQPIGESSHEL